MGTWLAVQASAATQAGALRGIEEAFAAVADVDAHLHPAREGSDVSQINAAADGSPVPIHASTWRVLDLAKRIHTYSEGLFDPCLPTRPGKLGDLRLSLGSASTPWAACLVPLTLDLGGIAKGYAIDSAIDALIDAGCTAGLVNAGGDLRLFGPFGETILVRGPAGRYRPLFLTDAAVAVSDVDCAHPPPGHRGYYLRVPVSARPSGRRHAVVVADRAVIADALAKCVLLGSEECVRRVTRTFNAWAPDPC